MRVDMAAQATGKITEDLEKSQSCDFADLALRAQQMEDSQGAQRAVCAN